MNNKGLDLDNLPENRVLADWRVVNPFKLFCTLIEGRGLFKG